MVRRLRILAAGIAVGVGTLGIAAARHGEDRESVKPLGARDLVERLDGKETRATAVQVTLEPGQEGAAHRHPGPAFGYILEGEYEWGIDDRAAVVLRAGDTFYEPTGCLHRVSKNPGKVKARLLAWVLHPRDAGRLVLPEPRP